jgi:hypothetical protein
VLPEYHELKTELAGLLQQFIRRRVASHSGFVGQVPKVRMFEGHRSALRRSDGDTTASDFKPISVSHSVPAASVSQMTFAEVLEHLDEMAAKIAREMSHEAFKQLDETLENAGQVFAVKGETMSPSVLLTVMNGLDMSFDDDGSHRNLTLVIHPNKTAATVAALKALEEDPEIHRQYLALIEQKREQWRVREASRRLVG